MIPINENNIDYNIKISLYYINDIKFVGTVNGNLTAIEGTGDYDSEGNHVIYIHFKLNGYTFFVISKTNSYKVKMIINEEQNRYYTLTEQEKNFIIYERKQIPIQDYCRLLNLEEENFDEFDYTIEECISEYFELHIEEIDFMDVIYDRLM